MYKNESSAHYARIPHGAYTFGHMEMQHCANTAKFYCSHANQRIWTAEKTFKCSP